MICRIVYLLCKCICFRFRVFHHNAVHNIKTGLSDTVLIGDIDNVVLRDDFQIDALVVMDSHHWRHDIGLFQQTGSRHADPRGDPAAAV